MKHKITSLLHVMGQHFPEDIAPGDDLTVLRVPAGKGRSTLLQHVRTELEDQGYHVIGAAPACKAAQNLESSSGIDSYTTASLIGRIERGTVSLDAKSALIIDEAGMAGTNDLSRLTAAVTRAGGRLVLVGDDRQQQEGERT
jgi:ATP-dependent exoDNAse (exonuclease V) alpha subunit